MRALLLQLKRSQTIYLNAFQVHWPFFAHLLVIIPRWPIAGNKLRFKVLILNFFSKQNSGGFINFFELGAGEIELLWPLPLPACFLNSSQYPVPPKLESRAMHWPFWKTISHFRRRWSRFSMVKLFPRGNGGRHETVKNVFKVKIRDCHKFDF